MRGIPTEKQHIDITLTRLGAHIVLRVRDYGTGLTEVEQARLFEPFYTDKATGLGLGLSISYNIVEEHGGTLTASTPGDGKGLLFSLSLPIVRQDDGTPERQSHVLTAQPSRRSAEPRIGKECVRTCRYRGARDN